VADMAQKWLGRHSVEGYCQKQLAGAEIADQETASLIAYSAAISEINSIYSVLHIFNHII
jgi:hypothetical protein